MDQNNDSNFNTPAEHLNTVANLLELALYAPDGEVTFEGRVALQRAARQVVVLSREIHEGQVGSASGVAGLSKKHGCHDGFS